MQTIQPSKLERFFNFFTGTKKRTHRSIFGALILVTGLSIWLIHTHNQLLEANDALTTVNQKIQTTQTDNDNLHQSVAELLSANRIQSIAQKNGMSLNNDQIAAIRQTRMK